MMHVTKLRTVTFVKDDNYVIIKRLVPLIALNERVKLLNGRDNDLRIRITQLLRQNPRTSITIRRTFLKLVILFHRLVVEVFTVNHKKHLVNIVQFTCQLSRLKTSQCFAAARGMPHITASLNSTELFIICSNLDTIQNTLSCYNLIRTHHQQ